jgi:outer membrane protein OmpA-like peptidoglycan-associated protein
MLLLACDVAVLDFIPFDRHATSVSAQAAATLDAIAEVMAAHPALSLEVVGHRDDGERGPLGERRAQAVRVALVARGVLASRLSVRDASDAQPMLPVAGLRGAPHAAARDRNRRVDFRVTSAPRTPGRPR